MNMITIDRSVVQQGLEALVQIYQRAATAETQSLSDAVLLWSANADNTPESVRVEIQEVLWIRSSITALRAALAQQAEPVQEPVAWMCSSPELMAKGYKRFSSRCEGDWNIPVYTAPPQRKPLSLTDLQEALVLTNLIDRDAIDDPEEYDEGSTLAQIDELHRIIKE